MLKSLYVKNYVLIDELKIDFDRGLNIITGETGAGKSILVDALGAVLGETMSRDTIRHGASKAIFEAQFTLDDAQPAKNVLLQYDVDDADTQLIVRRELNASGRSRAFVNDSPVSMAMLTELGDLLVDLHGQHEHQLLLKSSKHIDYLDAFAGHSEVLQQIKGAFRQLKESQKEIITLSEKQERVNQARDLLMYQNNEIGAVEPEAGEDEGLAHEELILRNAELLFEKSNALYEQLYNRDGAVVDLLRAAEKQLDELQQIDDSFSGFQNECENARIIIEDMANALQKYAGSVTFDAEVLENIRQRLSILNGLKKKYGGSLDAVLSHQQKIKDELELLENLQEAIENAQVRIEDTRLLLGKLSESASLNRRTSAMALSEQVTKELAVLGMPKAEFKVSQANKTTENATFVTVDGQMLKVGAKGFDDIEFVIRANPGEELKPLMSVASGGEISRVMLALKTLLAESDQVPVLVFDEIDAGISGRVAQAIGLSLRKLATGRQIISITHLPQIASMAHNHFLVEKQVDGDQTKTSIRRLSAVERQEQIARLFGGETVTQAHLDSAQDLIHEAEKLSREL
jgi:DNA repair protein RecN (Recombination protein N)